MEGQKVDWKRLVQFALLGCSDLEQYAILPVRVSLGLFCAISGARKLLSRKRRAYAPMFLLRVISGHCFALPIFRI
jgi:hypothetical protein